MQIEIFADAQAVARQAAELIAAEAGQAVRERGQFVFAVSGGTTPWQMLRLLAKKDLPWPQIHIVQVDERVAPPGDPDRNLTHLLESLRVNGSIVPAHIHAMPVEAADLEAGAREYGRVLEQLAGDPPQLDLVHLGLGPDGHTASLVQGDAVLSVQNQPIAVTGVYQGHRRMTLTYPVINNARRILWLATGESKATMLKRLLAADPTIPAGRVRQEQAMVLADKAAGSSLGE